MPLRVLLVALAACAGCTPVRLDPMPATSPTSAPPKFVLVIHGGAGAASRDRTAAGQAALRESLSKALARGRDILAAGGSAVDAVEATVRVMEDDERFNAGRGAVFNELGRHELDASIMDGSTLRCGAVGAVSTVKNPILAARKVMESSGTVLLVGGGAEAFAKDAGLEMVPNEYFNTPARLKELNDALERRKAKAAPAAAAKVDDAAGTAERSYGTVGAVALDMQGRLAAATSTGGRTAKRLGRVGDTPIIGAGNYADGNVAVSCTGVGEEFIRHGIARDVAARVQYSGYSLQRAADEQIFHRLKPGDGGLIAVSRTGETAMPFNTDSMKRGIADGNGRFEVHIFKDE